MGHEPEGCCQLHQKEVLYGEGKQFSMIIIRIFLSVSLSACLSYLSYIEVWRVSTPIGSLMALSTAYLTPPQPQKKKRQPQ